MKKTIRCFAQFFAPKLLVLLLTLTVSVLANADTNASTKAHHKTSVANTNTEPEIVKVGIYLNDVQNIDVHANNYLLDFYMWFKWKDKDSDPTASYEFMNHSESWATITNKPTEKAETLPDGWQYQVMHIQGRMSEKMDLRAYPFDRQNLVILIEDSAKDIKGLQYEIEEITVNPALKIPGFEFHKPELKSTNYTYPTRFGDLRMEQAGTYSRIVFKLPIYRNELTSFVKNILPIWLAVTCGIFSLMLHPRWIDSRFQIAIFSILSLVALQISNGNDLPSLQYMNLMDALYVAGYIFLICLMGELIIATKWMESENLADNERAKKLDKRFGYLGTTLFFIANLYLIFITFSQQ
jgi:hypothetical protein